MGCGRAVRLQRLLGQPRQPALGEDALAERGPPARQRAAAPPLHEEREQQAEGVHGVDDGEALLEEDDDALVNDLGMSSHDIVAFRGPPMEAKEMDYGHMSPTRMASLHAHQNGKHHANAEHPHDDYPQFCAFSRRMKHGAHCLDGWRAAWLREHAASGRGEPRCCRQRHRDSERARVRARAEIDGGGANKD